MRPTRRMRLISTGVAEEDAVSIVFRVQCAFVFRPIAFVRRYGTSAGSIVVTSLDGSNVRYLSAPDDELSDTSPAWSPDGDRVAFTSERDGNREIYVMLADGSNPSNLRDHPASDGQAAWSRDGTRIAFASDRDGRWEVYVMDVDGTNPTRLTARAGEDSEPTWAPDGSQIAFTCEDDGNLEVCVMDADGSNPTNVTRNPADDRSPVWSSSVPPSTE